MATQEEMDKKQVECAPECPGLDEKVLALPPEDKHLFRLSMLIPNSEIEYFVIKLGLSKHIWNDIALKYEYNHTTRGFIALYEWKKLKYRQYSRSSFQELSEALAHNYQTHFLCQLFKEEVIVYDIANIALQETPEDDVLKDLSEHVGNCAMHLGVELGLHMAAIEEILYRYPKDMFQQTFNVMKKWKTSSKVKTILMLMKVFQLVDARGLTFLREKYRMDAATTSRYESNYIKIAMVVLRVSPRAVRVQFDKEFHPDCLQGTLNKNDILLNDLKTKKRITQPQWNLLFPGTREPSSNDFDITLMICLLRNLIPIDIMDNRLPSATDTSVRADLSRIRFYRNLIVHRNLVTDTDFESYWNDVTPAILRLGGNSLKVECDDWYGRNIDAEQRDDGLKWIKNETRLALIEEELQEQSKQLAELVKQSKELAEQKSSITRTLLTHADLPHSMRTNDGTKELLSKGKFRSYENCIYLGGACNVGKSTLASILIGDDIPQHWNSTDGLHIYFGRNGIDLKTKKMVPFKQGSDVWSKVLLGQPDMTQEKYVQPQDSNKGNIITETHTIPQHKDNTLSTSTGPTPKDDENITDPLRQQSQILKVSKQNYTTIQENIKQEIRKGKYKIEIAPSDLIDFGGQRSFDMTHQLFIRHKGAFVLMFNGRINFSDPLEEYKQGETTESILTHWVNSILSYCTDDGDILPIIMFSATHSDYFNEVDRINRKAELIDGLRKIFKNHKRQHRIKYDDIFFINGKDKNDSEINRLKSKLVEVAFEQKSWGRRMPMAWVPLDLQMSEMRLINMNIISKEDLTTLNQRNEDLALTVEQMKDFLNDQHSLGKILYFDQHGLDKFIIVQPQSLVNILRSFITAKRFWPKDKKLRGILRTLTNTGKIDKQDLLELWSQDKFHQHMPNDDFKGFIIQVLVHLDILVQPTRDGQEQESQVQSYLVPCMVKRILPVTDFYVKSADKMICLSYTLLKSSIPAALSFKLIGAVINLWPLKETKDGICLYHQAAILCIDESNDLHLLVKDDKVVVYLINKGTKCFLSLNIASMVQECLTLTMTKVLEFYHKSFGKSLSTSEVSKAFELEVGEWCTSEGGCYISVPEAKEKIEWLCKNNKTHQTKYPLYWILDKKQVECALGCAGLDEKDLALPPEDKHLFRLAILIKHSEFEDLVIKLRLPYNTWNDISETDKYSPTVKRFVALCEWKSLKYKQYSQPSFKELSDALAHNYHTHILCQVFMEDVTVYGISANIALQEIPADDVLQDLSKVVCPCAMHLGIELGLSMVAIVGILYKYPKNLAKPIFGVMKKWKESSKVRTTILMLMKAFQSADGRGLFFLKEKYRSSSESSKLSTKVKKSKMSKHKKRSRSRSFSIKIRSRSRSNSFDRRSRSRGRYSRLSARDRLRQRSRSYSKERGKRSYSREIRSSRSSSRDRRRSRSFSRDRWRSRSFSRDRRRSRSISGGRRSFGRDRQRSYIRERKRPRSKERYNRRSRSYDNDRYSRSKRV